MGWHMWNPCTTHVIHTNTRTHVPPPRRSWNASLPLGFVPPGTTSPFPPSLRACRGTARSTIPTFKVPRTKASVLAALAHMCRGGGGKREEDIRNIGIRKTVKQRLKSYVGVSWSLFPCCRGVGSQAEVLFSPAIGHATSVQCQS